MPCAPFLYVLLTEAKVSDDCNGSTWEGMKESSKEADQWEPPPWDFLCSFPATSLTGNPSEHAHSNVFHYEKSFSYTLWHPDFLNILENVRKTKELTRITCCVWRREGVKVENIFVAKNCKDGGRVWYFLLCQHLSIVWDFPSIIVWISPHAAWLWLPSLSRLIPEKTDLTF